MGKVNGILSGLKFLVKNLAWVIVIMEILSFAIDKIQEQTNKSENNDSKNISDKIISE